MSLNDIWCLSPPNITRWESRITAQWPSLAQGFLSTTMFEWFWSGPKNFDSDYFPKSVSLSSGILAFGSGLPITSREIFIACEEVYRAKYLAFSWAGTSKFFNISAFLCMNTFFFCYYSILPGLLSPLLTSSPNVWEKLCLEIDKGLAARLWWDIGLEPLWAELKFS